MIHTVTFTSGVYSDTRWSIVRAFTARAAADNFVAECERIYREAKARSDDPDDAFEFDGCEETGWEQWTHPLTPAFDPYKPRWAVEEVELDGLWRTLMAGSTGQETKVCQDSSHAWDTSGPDGSPYCQTCNTLAGFEDERQIDGMDG